MARVSWTRAPVLLVVAMMVISTLEAAVLIPRFPRATSDTAPVVFPMSAAAPQAVNSPFEAGSFAAGFARGADKVTLSNGYTEHEGDHPVEPDFGRKFLDKFSNWKSKRSDTQTIIFPKMRSVLQS